MVHGNFAGQPRGAIHIFDDPGVVFIIKVTRKNRFFTPISSRGARGIFIISINPAKSQQSPVRFLQSKDAR
jgi:hypothetical protein